MKICFIVPDGVGIRNYLYSDILKELVSHGHEIMVWHALSDNALNEVEKHHKITLYSEKLPYYKESVKEKFFREAVCYARLRYNTKKVDNPTIMTNWSPSLKKMSHRFFYRGVEIVGSYLRSYASILNMETRYYNKVRQSHYMDAFKKILATNQPDIVFNTHQRAVRAIVAIEAAKEMGIKTYSAIYSWDNLPKARLNTRTDRYIVWSEYMKNEMKIFYPEIEDEDMVITGTPQFDFYQDRSLYWTKEEFCHKFGLDPDKKIICFSGDDIRTSPYDPDYLKDLAEAIGSMPHEEKVQILFRRCPVDLSERYDTVLQAYREHIKVSDPLWNRDAESEDWALVYPSFLDVQLLVNIILHCDVVYNLGSTMAHDFAIFDKPAIYINYDQLHAREWSVKTIYSFQHFRSMQDKNAVYWVNSKDAIAECIQQALNMPYKSSVKRKKWLTTVTGSCDYVSKDIVNLFIEK